MNWSRGSAERSARRAWLALGWVSVLAPAALLGILGWDSGEHGGSVILIGLSVTLGQILMWGLVRIVLRRRTSTIRAIAFGGGAPIALAASVLVLADTGSPAWAATTYTGAAVVAAAVGSRLDKPPALHHASPQVSGAR